CAYSALGHADYLGCFVEFDDSFPHYFRTTMMTIDACILRCEDYGFKYAAVVGYRWCFCFNDQTLEFARNVTDSECNLPCDGNLSQMCGGSESLSLYRI
ncbi:Hypothetical predicted protein, partial [Mytilus galloprovincialis]